MTKSQRRQHKIGNQIRKYKIISAITRRGKKEYVRFFGGVIQDGSFTQSARSVWSKIRNGFAVA